MKISLASRLGAVFAIVVFAFGLLFVTLLDHPSSKLEINTPQAEKKQDYPLNIVAMKEKAYPGSDLVTEETLSPGSNYQRHIASYKSDVLKIYGLLTVPDGKAPNGGFPVIIFNHGYIPPEQYQTTERYVAYQDGFASASYATFKSDYRGNGNSQGSPEGAYFSPAYTVDVLNTLSSVKKLPYVNPNKIGMWGHSIGGNITQRALVVDPKDIKASVLWGGVVGSYTDLFNDWWNKHPRPSFTPSPRELNAGRTGHQSLIKEYGEPSLTNAFWNSISPTSYLSGVTAPIQLHQGLADEEVPPQLTRDFYQELKNAGKNMEVYYYEGNDHNLSQSFNLAMQRSVDFFNKYLK